jgi:hypothetical protein
MSEPLTLIERIEIQLACERLVHAYCRALDQGDMDAAADLFASHGSFARPTAPDAVIAGREAIRASLRARPATLRTRHLSTNVIVEVEGPDAARGVSYLTMVSTTPAEGATPPHESRGPVWFGEMRDRFVRENGEWKFLERRGSVQIKHIIP